MSSKTKTTATTEEATPALVPKMRFPEFRKAKGWTGEKLGSKTNKVGSGITPTGGDKNYKLSGRPFVRSQNIGWGVLLLDDVAFIDEETHNSFSSTQINVSDVLLNITGASIGRSAVADAKIKDGNVNQHVCIIRVKPDELSPYFLNQYLISHDGQKQIDSFQAGGNRQGLNFEQIRSFLVPLPAVFAEQQKIAECLSSVDELIAAQARKLDALKTHKKGLMQQLFPREGETQPRLRFPEFQNAGEWEQSPLSKFILLLDAGVSVNSGDSRPANMTEFGVLKTSAITKGRFDAEENKVVLAESELSRLKEPVTGGTIIMCRKNTPALVGANAYVEASHENLFLPDLLWAAKPREKVSMRFLAFILGSDKGRAALSKLAKGSSASMSNITKPEVLAFSVMAPSPAEQKRIASCLTSLDDLITAETQKHAALKTHKKGLMQQLFPSPEEVEV